MSELQAVHAPGRYRGRARHWRLHRRIVHVSMRLRASPRDHDAVGPRPPLPGGRVIPAALFCPTLHVDSTRIRSILGTGVAWRVAYREDGRGISGARAPVRADGERSDRSGTE